MAESQPIVARRASQQGRQVILIDSQRHSVKRSMAF